MQPARNLSTTCWLFCSSPEITGQKRVRDNNLMNSECVVEVLPGRAAAPSQSTIMSGSGFAPATLTNSLRRTLPCEGHTLGSAYTSSQRRKHEWVIWVKACVQVLAFATLLTHYSMLSFPNPHSATRPWGSEMLLHSCPSLYCLQVRKLSPSTDSHSCSNRKDIYNPKHSRKCRYKKRVRFRGNTLSKQACNHLKSVAWSCQRLMH